MDVASADEAEGGTNYRTPRTITLRTFFVFFGIIIICPFTDQIFQTKPFSMRGTRKEGCFTGDTKDMPSKALETCVCFHRGPVLGEHGGKLLFLGSSREGKNFF